MASQKKQTGLGNGEGRRKRKGKKGRGREEKRKRGGRKEGEIVDGFTYKIRFSEKNSLRGSYLGGTPQTPATPPIGPQVQSEGSPGPTPPRGAPGSGSDDTLSGYAGYNLGLAVLAAITGASADAAGLVITQHPVPLKRLAVRAQDGWHPDASIRVHFPSIFLSFRWWSSPSPSLLTLLGCGCDVHVCVTYHTNYAQTSHLHREDNNKLCD